MKLTHTPTMLFLCALLALARIPAAGSIIGSASANAPNGCTATARYDSNSGSAGSNITAPPCGYSVLPSGPGATAVLLQASSGPLLPSSSVSADLATGIMKGVSSGSTSGGQSSAIMGLLDTVDFMNNNAGSVLLGVNWYIDGTDSLAALGGSASSVNMTYDGTLGGSGVIFNFAQDSRNGVTANSLQVTGLNQSTVPAVRGHIGSTVTSFVSLAPGLNELGFKEDLSLSAINNASIDFEHTLQVSLNLPANVTYTSASGVFLTATTVPAPEPDTFGLIGLTLAGLAWLGRRRLAIRSR